MVGIVEVVSESFQVKGIDDSGNYVEHRKTGGYLLSYGMEDVVEKR